MNRGGTSLSPYRVSEGKIRDYLLNAAHEDGRHKSRFFESFGFRVEQWSVLAEALRRHPVENGIEEVGRGRFGVKYVAKCRIRTPDGRAPCVLTVWLAEDQEAPRLITAYPA